MINTTIPPVNNSQVIVVGAGVVGLSVAFKLASHGLEVTVVDPFPGRGASFVAAGMIAPVTEAAYGEESLVELSIAAGQCWTGFAQLLASRTNYDIGLEHAGTLTVARDSNDRAQLRSLVPLYTSLGLKAIWQSSQEIREMEPLLSPAARGGFAALDDIQVDNRRLLSALFDALANLGTTFTRERVTAIIIKDARIHGVKTESGEIFTDHVVICAGLESGSIDGLPEIDRPILRPVKGQILRLAQRNPALRLRHSVRALTGGRAIYCVPRTSGQVVVGATMEEKGRSLEPTAGGVQQLLADAIAIVPSLFEAELQHVDVGLRPATVDNAPIIGESGTRGLMYAAGHYRHGVLFSPITADAIYSVITTGALPLLLEPFAPRPSTQPASRRVSR
jgi:glycine oxidase